MVPNFSRPKMSLLTFVSVLAASFLQCSSSLPSYIPDSWHLMCNETIPTSNTSPWLRLHTPTETTVVNIYCYIQKTDEVLWKLNDLQTWTRNNNVNKLTVPSNRTVVYNITITCEATAKISLPWPMKVVGLQELKVSYCFLVDKYLNYNDPITAGLPDEMRVLDIRHSSWLLDQNSSSSLLENLADGGFDITSDYDCGHDTTLEWFASVNVSDIDQGFSTSNLPPLPIPSDFDLPLNSEGVSDATGSFPVKPEDQIIKDKQKVISDQNDATGQNFQSPFLQMPTSNSSRDAELRFLDALFNTTVTRTSCNYKKLTYYDESFAPLTPLFHFEIMVKDAQYPVLKTMNFSYIGLKELPRELKQWRRYFTQLRLLNLSHNYVSSVEVENYASRPGVGVVTFDLTSNNISVINLDILQSWAKVEKFFVNISDNPIHCGCDIAKFLTQLQNKSLFTGNLQPYEYVKYLKCKTPETLEGRELYTLTADSVSCPSYPGDNLAALIALGICMAIILVLLIVIIRYKVEIRILLYTRFHLRLPCDADAQRNSKTYDAFISYSNDDAKWVYENLVKFLESPETDANTYATIEHENYTKNSNSSSKRENGKSFRLCIHQRDFIPGKTIFDNIVDCIESSRHTIIVLSPSFMKSHWAMEELRQAYRQSLVEKTRHLIVILLEKVSKDDMDPLINRCCKTFTYLDVSDSLFKDRLVFSLTTKDRSAQRRDKLAAKRDKLPRSPSEQLESVCYDNIAYVSRPPEPVRELSNMSTSSTTALTPY